MAENIAECHFCGKGFASLPNRNRHIKDVHQSIRPFKCSECDFTFKQKIHRDVHHRNVHGNVSRPKAHNSKISHYKSRNHLSGFSMKGRLGGKLSKHSSRNHKTLGLGLFDRENVAGRTCDVCSAVFSFRQGMLTHRKVHFQKTNPSINKPNKISRGHTEASMSTDSLKIIRISPNSGRIAHSQNRGSSSKPTCDICHQVFSYRFVMLRHRRGHVSEKHGQMGESISPDKCSSETKQKVKHTNRSRGAYPCDICEIVFSFKTSMVRHRKIHFRKTSTTKAKLTCDICNKSFGNRLNMLKHRSLHFSKEDNAAEDDWSPVDSVNLKKEAGAASTDKDEETHVDHEAHTATETPRRKCDKSTCNICGKTYSNHFNMLRHRKTHQNPSRKDVKKITTWKQMHLGASKKTEMHKDKNLSPQLMLINDENVGSQLSDVKMEKESQTTIVDGEEREKINQMMRSNKGSVKCLICHKKFSRNWGLKLHVRGVHLKVKPYRCKLCVRSFHRKEALLLHRQNQHSSASPHLEQRQSSKTTEQQSSRTTEQPFLSQKMALKDKYHRQTSWHSARGLQKIPNRTSKTCPVCARVFSHRGNMMRHKKLVHGDAAVESLRSKNKSMQHISEIPSGPSKTSSVLHLGATNKTEMDKDEHLSPQLILLNDENDSSQLSDVKMENASETTAVDEDEREKINQMMRSNKGCVKCLICHKNFARNWGLKLHVKSIHLKVKPHQCKLCVRSFYRKQQLLLHRQQRHSSRSTENASQTNIVDEDELPGKAQPDGKLPDQSIDEKINQMMRSKEGTTCLICHKKFSRLRLHVKAIHLKLKPYRCKLCDCSFNRKPQLLLHRQQRHSSWSTENASQTNIVDEDEREKINQMMQPKTVELSDSKMENASETTIVDEDEREKINQMMRSTVGKKCLVCHKKYARNWGLKIHVKNVHLKVKPHQCKLCVRSFYRKHQLLRHRQQKHSSGGPHLEQRHSSRTTEQPFLSLRRVSKDKYRRHKSWHSVRGLKKIPRGIANKCPICLHVFSARSNMVRHLKQVHGTEHVKSQNRTSRTCSVCSRVFTQRWSMVRHMRQVHGTDLENSENKTLQDISETPDVVKIPEDMNGDPVLEDEAEPHFIKKRQSKEDRTCAICHKVFYYRKEMLKHMEVVHASHPGQQGKSPYTMIPNGRQSSKPHIRKKHSREERTCDVCGKIFPYRSEMLRHKSWHPGQRVSTMENHEAGNDPTPPITGENIKEMLTSVHLNSPTKRLPLKNIECDICKKLFRTNFSMLRHRRTHQPEEVLPTRAPLNLDGEQKTRSDTHSHLEGEGAKRQMPNTAALKYRCKACNKMFFSRSLLMKHHYAYHRRKHTPEQILPARVPADRPDETDTTSGTQTPLECEKDKSQASAPNYKCKKCNKLYLSQSLLVKHHYAYHVEKWRFPCSQCDEQFNLQFHLNSHMRRVHGGAPIVENQTELDNEISARVDESISKTSTMSAPPTPPPDPIETVITEMKTQSSGPEVEIGKSRHRNSSGSSHSSLTPSVGSSPSVKSSHSASSMHSGARSSSSLGSLADMKVYRCTMCRHIFTNSEDWREHLSQHLGGGTKIVHLGSEDCNAVKCEEGEKPAENTWSYTCPSCKVEVQGSLNLVMHIKTHML